MYSYAVQALIFDRTLLPKYTHLRSTMWVVLTPYVSTSIAEFSVDFFFREIFVSLKHSEFFLLFSTRYLFGENQIPYSYMKIGG